MKESFKGVKKSGHASVQFRLLLVPYYMPTNLLRQWVSCLFPFRRAPRLCGICTPHAPPGEKRKNDLAFFSPMCYTEQVENRNGDAAAPRRRKEERQ